LLDFRRSVIPSFDRFWLFDDCSSLGLFYKRLLTLKVPLCQKIFHELFSALLAPFASGEERLYGGSKAKSRATKEIFGIIQEPFVITLS
jgi:hypothetical protein